MTAELYIHKLKRRQNQKALESLKLALKLIDTDFVSATQVHSILGEYLFIQKAIQRGKRTSFMSARQGK